ncbi:ABC-type glycerol-3-phosphate transport system substrate-binding protein [Agromyces hippuratus]|uniref:ABC-type glycerol-3-phosphate transport system substrate-binding protein n=1 Tax=Agromyces hippuratus TaxID=286438 RepID=A0A852X0K4_9MICO|nr:extracellular solute-binding protein [Agromyces hippuratus]NYG22050.1 ABC-type glycerol-3-phosphate transport system substrate-binding protein [Agromyces hippuratus]
MKSPRKVVIAGIAAFAMVGALAACSSGGSESGKTELRVATFPPGADAAAYEAFDAQEKQFEKANPDIDIIGVEYEWEGPTFAVQLAGGSLPDVFTVPFTDSKTLLENGQLMDVTDEIEELGYTDSFNPVILDGVTDADGRIFGFPRQAYAMGLHYNRTLFEQAGLDPDSPPTTWDEVREDAKVIADETGKAGYMQMTQNNTGGWQLTAATVARGGSTQTDNGDGTYTSTIANDGTKASLEFLKELRWEDDSLGSNFLLDWGSINQEFAAGNIGMYTTGSDIYTALVRDFSLNPDDYGLTVIPIENDGGTLGGGDIAVVSPTVDDETKAAAITWIDWFYMQKLLDEDAAVLDAKTLAESDQAVGTPLLPVLNREAYEQSLVWIEPYINVPRDQMTPFIDGIWEQTPVGEPKGKTQEIYALLDPVVQAVLTDQNADIDALLEQADAEAQALLDE